MYLKPRANLAVRDVEGETVVFDRDGGRIHQLNPTATFVWAAFMALTGLVTSGLQMAVARAGAGFGGSARIPISPALIADQYPIAGNDK